jgi:all-trans-retinol 13,14-reductase
VTGLVVTMSAGNLASNVIVCYKSITMQWRQHLAERDLIIIGAGINGLSAGLAYILNSDLEHKRVLIVEKNPAVGGYVSSFARKGFQFDTCQMISNISDILDYFGVYLDFHQYREDCIRVFRVSPGDGSMKTFELYSGENAFEEQFIRLFPTESRKLQKFFDYSLAMFQEIYSVKYSPNFGDILKMLITSPKVVRNRNKTFAQYLRTFGIDNPEISLLFQIFSSMCGLPNDKIAALLTVGVMYSLRERAYRPKGPFVSLPRRMQLRFLELGGEVLLKTEVEKIIVDERVAQGVRLTDGTVIRSPNIISTNDPKASMERLVGMDVLRSISSRYARKLESIEMTTSSFTVNLGVDDPRILVANRLPCGYALLTSGNDAFPRLYAAFERNKSTLSDDCFYIGMSCPSLEERSRPVLSIQAVPMPVGDWMKLRNTNMELYTREKEKLADLLIGIVERHLIPGLKEHIIVKDISTPATFARYSGSPSGSIYDMASVPDNFGANRLPVVTPIHGLLLPKFAHGVFGAMNSGMQAADILLDGKVMHGNSRFKNYLKSE